MNLGELIQELNKCVVLYGDNVPVGVIAKGMWGCGVDIDNIRFDHTGKIVWIELNMCGT